VVSHVALRMLQPGAGGGKPRPYGTEELGSESPPHPDHLPEGEGVDVAALVVGDEGWGQAHREVRREDQEVAAQAASPAESWALTRS
jgi:hypothetical protein